MNARPVATTGPEEGGAVAGLKHWLTKQVHAGLAPVVSALAFLRVSADHLSALGLVLSVGAGLAFFEGWFPSGSAFAAGAGLCDVLDGELARRRGTGSRFGAFLDSVLDRLGEAMILAGIAGFYISGLVDLALDPLLLAAQLERGLEPRTWAAVALAGMLALIGSFMVSYTRARAEGLGVECKVGWFERPERLLLLIVAGAFGVGRVMPAALLLLVLLSFTTAIQRTVHVWKQTRSAGRDS